MVDKVVTSTYERLWSDADRIRSAAYRCGGPRMPRRAGDYLGFDLLNGGLREVWTLAESLGLNSDSRVLELGCGIGGPARFIAERYSCRVSGVDVTPRQIAIARALTKGLDVGSQVEYVLADNCRLPFASETFSHIYSIEAFVHVADKPAAIKEAFRVLKPGGVFYIQDPVHDPSLQIAFLENTLHPLSLEEYHACLAEAGFCDVKAIDNTEQSKRAYTLLSQLVSYGPISPWKVLSTFKRLHPGIRPPIWRYLSPGRIRHTIRYLQNRYEAALDLLGDPDRVEGIHRMCEEIVDGYETGAIKLYQICATRSRA